MPNFVLIFSLIIKYYRSTTMIKLKDTVCAFNRRFIYWYHVIHVCLCVCVWVRKLSVIVMIFCSDNLYEARIFCGRLFFFVCCTTAPFLLFFFGSNQMFVYSCHIPRKSKMKGAVESNSDIVASHGGVGIYRV
jgi:hypothetical protein